MAGEKCCMFNRGEPSLACDGLTSLCDDLEGWVGGRGGRLMREGMDICIYTAN